MVTLHVRVTTNAPSVRRAIEEFGRKHVPYATAVALTRIAQHAQREIKVEMPQRFHIRSPYPPLGVRIQPAFKKDWPRCYSVVGDKDEWMVLHETGGWKRPSQGAKDVAIPTKLVVRQRKPGGALPGKLKPRFLLDHGAYKTPDEIRRSGKRARSQLKRLGNATFFLLRSATRIRPRWGFARTTRLQVGAWYGREFRKVLQIAANEAAAGIRQPRALQGPASPFIPGGALFVGPVMPASYAQFLGPKAARANRYRGG